MTNKIIASNKPDIWNISGWIFGAAVLITGILNMFLVHIVPGIAYLLISFVYLPPANAYIRKQLGFTIPLLLKIVLGVVLIMFTLGVSDLGNMIDKL